MSQQHTTENRDLQKLQDKVGEAEAAKQVRKAHLTSAVKAITDPVAPLVQEVLDNIESTSKESALIIALQLRATGQF